MQVVPEQPSLEDSSIAQLYERYWLAILSVIRQHVPTKEDAEDALLEVFLAALQDTRLPYMGERQQLAWLRRVAHNKCIDYHRRAARRRALPIEQAAEMLFDDEKLLPEQVALRHEQLALLQERLRSLPEPQQEVLRLRFGDQLSCAEIAAHMQKSEGAIRTLLSRALNLLRDIYASSREEK
jgi:RNA polymerase sigma factor (sigma-70 family)